MGETIDYGQFRSRLERVRPRWPERAAMSPAEFAAHLADTGPRWTLLREFQEEWGYRPTGRAVWRRDRVNEHKDNVLRLFGADERKDLDVDPLLPVPAAVEEWWDIPGNSYLERPDLYWTHAIYPPTVRPDPSGYGVNGGLAATSPYVDADDDHRVCVLMAENQFCNEWGYAAAHAGLADPPMLVAPGASDTWDRLSWSVTEYFLLLAVTRLPAHFGHAVQFETAPAGLVERTRETLPEMGFLPWRELDCVTTFHGGSDVIVDLTERDADDVGYSAYGRNAAALERLAHTLGVSWATEIRPPDEKNA